MTLFVIFKDREKYTFYGLKEYGIEYGKYLKFTYVGKNADYDYKNKLIVHEGCFMLDAIAGYYIHR